MELATGQFPYKNCKTDFEVLTKVLQEDPPLLPLSMGFSLDFQSFVKDWCVQMRILSLVFFLSYICIMGVILQTYLIERIFLVTCPQPHKGSQKKAKIPSAAGKKAALSCDHR